MNDDFETTQNQIPETIDPYDQLLVRACKMENPSFVRLKRIVARRCGRRPDQLEEVWVAAQLVEILEKFKVIGLAGFIPKLHESEKLRNTCDTRGCEDPFTASVVAASCRVLSTAMIDKFPGYRLRSKIRRKHGNGA